MAGVSTAESGKSDLSKLIESSTGEAGMAAAGGGDARVGWMAEGLA